MKSAILKRLLWLLIAAGAIVGGAAGVGWGVRQVIETTTAKPDTEVPTTTVRKGAVTLTVSAKGELQGGNSESLTVPVTGGAEVAIISLHNSGDWVNAGEVVAEFDPTQQEFNLREAEADLAEATQKVEQAQADAETVLEEARYQVLATAAEVKIAEQEIRKNELLAPLMQRQNQINLDAAKNRAKQAEQDYKNRQAANGAGVGIQQAGVQRAKLTADAAHRIIDSLTLKAKTSGYVQVMPNRNVQIAYTGMSFPQFQIGDTVRSGQAVAQIPDMSQWVVSARIPEADRGYLERGQSVVVRPAALPGREFKGKVTVLGGSAGYAYNRTFECRIALDKVDPDLRPGMSANVEITANALNDVLWIPSQALFENDGQGFVYLKTPEGFVTQNVTLVRRGESQAVITGLAEGQLVALARPDQQKQDAASDGGLMKALPK